MQIDEAQLADIDRAREAGAVILLKWDGERSARVYTVVASHPPSDFIFRADTDDMEGTIREALEAWRGARA